MKIGTRVVMTFLKNKPEVGVIERAMPADCFAVCFADGLKLIHKSYLVAAPSKAKRYGISTQNQGEANA